MAKNSNVTYTTLSISAGSSSAKALTNLETAEALFQKVALEACTKAGLIPSGMYGKIVRNRFGGGWQLALSPDQFTSGSRSAAAAI